jgi:hypothetical protein
VRERERDRERESLCAIKQKCDVGLFEGDVQKKERERK